MKFNKETFRAPQTIFVLYIIAASLIIMGFRYIFPGEAAPLPIFSRNWRFIRGVADLLTLFPALSMSALVAPFGLAVQENHYTSFSPQFFRRLTVPIVIAICSTVIYGLVFFLILPMVKNSEEDMRYRGELYRLSKERAQIHNRAKEWLEASRFIEICDRIWPNSPELAAIRNDINIELSESGFEKADERAAARTKLEAEWRSAEAESLPGRRQPLNATDAIELGEAAFKDQRYYDAHWFATLAERLKPGSPEAAAAGRLAARSWNQIEFQQPTPQERQLYTLYNLKQSGYQAMVAGEWIRAYYIFQELAALNPDDPDVTNFLAASERATKEAAFFMDEMKVSLREVLTGAVFSLPSGKGQGRAVLRISSLSASSDEAYGIGLEYLGFDAQARPLVRVQAPYAKITPFTVDGQRKVLILMRALDRENRNLRWEPEWSDSAGTAWHPGEPQIILDLSYEDFIMLSQLRQGLSNMQISELFATAKKIGDYGYVPEVFEAEILNRLGTALFFLPISIVAIIIGWSFRSKRRARYLFIPLLAILPIVFNGITQLYRSLLNNLGIWLILSLGFSAAFGVYVILLTVSFIVSLIALAAQHG